MAKGKGTTVALRETIWLALDTLRAHKLRSFLTLLGVILAVTTLVAVISIVEGLNSYVAERIANLGSNVFGVDKFGVITSRDEFMKARKRPSIRHEEFAFLKENMTHARALGAVQFSRAEVRYGNEVLEEVSVQGVTPDYAEIRSITVGNGRMLNETDETHRAQVCFVGPDIVGRFFPGIDPIGRSIRVGRDVYVIVGVAKPLGSVFGQSQDNYVHIPMGAYQKGWQRQDYSLRVFVQAWGPDSILEAQDEVRVLLRARRHVPYMQPDNFAIVSSSTFTSLFAQLTGNIFRIAIMLTSVFLVVGGIVIMNIMLASVTERTREIGIRKSLGARRRHIVMQFLVESTLLSGIGGILGILAAVAIGAVVTATTPMPIRTPMSAVLTALTLSTSVGLFFGIYPAVRASRLDPIEALRFEA